MVNSVDRRDFRLDEYELYDVKKARPYWNKICTANEWQIIKNEEDYKEDFICQISNDIYIMELQIIAYWHNFSQDFISNLYISANKVDNLKEKAQIRGIKAGLIFLNCVPNRFIGVEIDQVKDDYKKFGTEKSYKIPKKIIKSTYTELIDDNYCDCLDNHYEIMQRENGRIPMAERLENIRGKNGICC